LFLGVVWANCVVNVRFDRTANARLDRILRHYRHTGVLAPCSTGSGGTGVVERGQADRQGGKTRVGHGGFVFFLHRLCATDGNFSLMAFDREAIKQRRRAG
jgi:hypothetical protein